MSFGIRSTLAFFSGKSKVGEEVLEEGEEEESEIFGTPGNKTRKGAGISGVNRRTAVLFTRKKAANKGEADTPDKSAIGSDKVDKKRVSRRNEDAKADSADETPKKGNYLQLQVD